MFGWIKKKKSESESMITDEEMEQNIRIRNAKRSVDKIFELDFSRWSSFGKSGELGFFVFIQDSSEKNIRKRIEYDFTLHYDDSKDCPKDNLIMDVEAKQFGKSIIDFATLRRENCNDEEFDKITYLYMVLCGIEELKLLKRKKQCMRSIDFVVSSEVDRMNETKKK